MERRKKVGAKRALKPRQIWAIRFFRDREGRLRERALFDLAIDSKLRGSDLVKIKIGALVSGQDNLTRAMAIQQKTEQPVQFELVSDARTRFPAWLERRGGTIDDFAFPSRIDHSDHLSTRQYARLVDEWVTASVYAARNMVRIRSDALRLRSSTRIKADLKGNRRIVPCRC